MITTCFNGCTINYFRMFRLLLHFYYYKWHHDKFTNTIFSAINYLPSAQHQILSPSALMPKLVTLYHCQDQKLSLLTP